MKMKLVLYLIFILLHFIEIFSIKLKNFLRRNSSSNEILTEKHFNYFRSNKMAKKQKN